MNSKCEPPIWQTWSEKWGSWDNWYQAGVRRIAEESTQITRRPDFEADQALLLNSTGRPRKIRTIESRFVDCFAISQSEISCETLVSRYRHSNAE
jgi:hypothetical protein